MSHRVSVANFFARRSCSYVLTPLAAGLLVALPALAQQQPVGNLEEIIVTAEFRAANVQNTPIAITAVNAEMLDARSQTNLYQITAQAPNVSLRPAGSSFGSALVAYIRGIGQSDFNPSVEPGVGIYVDDVYYSTITGNLLDLLDLDRVEVLRGPQGTLAGRNAIGGAIKLFTRQPDGRDDLNISITKGSFDRTEVKGAAGLTLVPDKLYARIAGVAKAQDGYITRYDFACQNNLPAAGTPGGLPRYTQSQGCKLGNEGGASYTSGRFSLRWDATDKFQLDFSASITNDNSEAQPSVLVAVAGDHSGSSIPILSPTLAGTFTPNPAFNPAAATLVPSFYDNNGNHVFDAGDVPYDTRFVTGGKFYNYSTYIDDGKSTPYTQFQGGTPGKDTSVWKPYVITPVNTLSSWDAAVNLHWKISDTLALLAVFSHRTYDNHFAEDTDGSPIAVQQLLQVLKHEQDTEELRFSWSLKSVDLTFGAFYLDQKTNEDARVDLPYVGFDFIHGPDRVPATNKAIYANAALHLTENTDLSLGIRDSKDTKSYTFQRHNPDGSDVQPCALVGGLFPNPFFWESVNPPNCGVFGDNNLSIPYSSSHTDYRVALSHDFGKSLMLYGQYSTGYKAGGNNARPFFPSQSHAFNPETLDSVEVGLKSTIGGNVRLNAAIFSNTYNDIQLPTNTCFWAPPGQQQPCASQDNIGDADVWGAELEAEWHPGEHFSLDASYSHLNFDYTRVEAASSVKLGMISPYTPENKASLGVQYRFGLKGGGTVTPRLDEVYTDQVYSNAANAPTNLIPAYTLTNIRVTWRGAKELWETSLEGTNLGDKYYYVTLFDLTGGGSGYINGQPGRPREWAMTFKRNFE